MQSRRRSASKKSRTPVTKKSSSPPPAPPSRRKQPAPFRLHVRTERQQEYLDLIQSHDLTFGIGPAGTGKTFLAVAKAVEALREGTVDRIILVRPAVEAGEKLGFLPGSMQEKVDPYCRPIYDALGEMLGAEHVTDLVRQGVIEIAPLAFMRGRTLKKAFVLVDEAQNTTTEQLLMVVTRFGKGAKMVVNGDLNQNDLARGIKSGLLMAVEAFDGVSGVAILEFGDADIVRHALVGRLLEAHKDWKENG